MKNLLAGTTTALIVFLFRSCYNHFNIIYIKLQIIATIISRKTIEAPGKTGCYPTGLKGYLCVAVFFGLFFLIFNVSYSVEVKDLPSVCESSIAFRLSYFSISGLVFTNIKLLTIIFSFQIFIYQGLAGFCIKIQTISE